MVIFKTIEKPHEFEQFWWISLIGIVSLVAISIWAYFGRKLFLNKESCLTYILFPIFVLLLLGVVSVFSCYNFSLCFALNIIASIGFTVVLVLHFIPSINNLKCFKVFIIYTFIITGNILFIVFQKEYYVEFFVISVYISMVFTYIIYKLNDLFGEFVKNCEVNPEIQLVKQYLTAAMLMNTHMIVCMFKD